MKEYFEYSIPLTKKINEELLPVFEEHPVWGAIVKMQTQEERDAQNERSQSIQRAAIYEGKWDAYIDDLTMQGAMYAKMNIRYVDWYQLIKLYKDYLIPHIERDFGDDGRKALRIINGVGILVDFAMYVIAEAYFQEKNDTIVKMNNELESKVSIRTQQLAQKNRETEQLAYVVAHDLQEPLRTMTSFAQLLQSRHSEQLDETANQYLSFIVKASSRMSGLIKGLLDFSRLGLQRKREPVNLNDLLKEVLDDLDSTIQTSHAKVEVTELPELSCFAVEMRMLFQNLIGNAIKFVPANRSPVIQISSEQLEMEWTFRVSDNGIGMAEDQKDKVFTIFQRLNSKSDYEGTGIGLAHCKKIVEMHGGTISVESKLGEGSTFVFTIPVAVD